MKCLESRATLLGAATSYQGRSLPVPLYPYRPERLRRSLWVLRQYLLPLLLCALPRGHRGLLFITDRGYAASAFFRRLLRARVSSVIRVPRREPLQMTHQTHRLEQLAADLMAALSLVYPYARHQRCWVHKLRNVVNRVRKADQEQVVRGPREIYLAATRREAIAAFRRWKQRWQQAYPAAVACLERDLEALLCCFDYPAWLRPKIRTTNPIERAFREVRRRTRPMTAFTNDQSCERIVYALFQHLNAQWGRTRRRHSTHKS